MAAGLILPVRAQDMQEYHAQHIGRTIADTGTLRQMIRDAMGIFPGNHDSAILLVTKAEYFCRQTKFDQGIFLALNVRASFLRNLGLYDSSIAVLKQAIPFTRAPELKGYTHGVYNSMALSASNTGRYEQALQWYGQALEAMHIKRFTDNHSTIDSGAILVNMAVMWARLGEYEQSVKSLKQAEEIAVAKRNWYGQTQVCLNLGEVSRLSKNYGEATRFFRKALYLTRYHDENNFRFCAWGGLAHIYLEQGKSAQALSLLRDTIMADKTTKPDAYLYLHWQHSLGLAYLQLKEYSKAFSLLKKSLDSAVSLSHDELILLIAPDAARAASAIGRYHEAYDFLSIYASLRDTMFEKGKVRFLHAWSNARVAEKDKTVFAQQLFIARQHGQIQSRNFIVAAAAGSILLLLICGLWLYRSYRHRQKIQQAGMQQLQQQQEISRLKARVQGEEQERNRIAAELHNGVAAQLWGARMNMDILQRHGRFDEQQQRQLQDIYNQLEETAQDVRNTAHNMMPDLLLDEGLGPALASLCIKTGRNTELEAEYQEYGNVPRLDPEIEHLLYRMVQELVQNTMKHALTATHLLVQLSCSNTILNITVEDNGRGFSSSQEHYGIGLQHICRNVHTLRGNIDIKSSPGEGAAIYLEFDIQHLL